jgi:hypothetical protein
MFFLARYKVPVIFVARYKVPVIFVARYKVPVIFVCPVYGHVKIMLDLLTFEG